jgi:hypothetical protein
MRPGLHALPGQQAAHGALDGAGGMHDLVRGAMLAALPALDDRIFDSGRRLREIGSFDHVCLPIHFPGRGGDFLLAAQKIEV